MLLSENISLYKLYHIKMTKSHFFFNNYFPHLKLHFHFGENNYYTFTYSIKMKCMIILFNNQSLFKSNFNCSFIIFFTPLSFLTYVRKICQSSIFSFLFSFKTRPFESAFSIIYTHKGAQYLQISLQ